MSRRSRSSSAAIYGIAALWGFIFIVATLITDPDVFVVGQLFDFSTIHHEHFVFLIAVGTAVLFILSLRHPAVEQFRDEQEALGTTALGEFVVAILLLFGTLGAFLVDWSGYAPVQLLLGFMFVTSLTGFIAIAVARGHRARLDGG